VLQLSRLLGNAFGSMLPKALPSSMP